MLVLQKENDGSVVITDNSSYIAAGTIKDV